MRLVWTSSAHAAAAIALVGFSAACNALWGIDDLSYEGVAGSAGGSGTGTETGTGTTTGTPSGASTGTGSTSTGAGAAGGTGGTGGTAGSGGSAGTGGGSVVQDCGNGTAEGTEQCDDGDTESGDGCSGTCQMECPNNSFMSPTTFHCYLPSAGEETWWTAQTDCSGIDGHLVTFSDSTEYQFVQDGVPDWDPGYYWIGARDDGSGYAWYTGEPFSFTSWHPAEPDPGICAFSGLATDEWFTAGCISNQLYYVCEVDPAGW